MSCRLKSFISLAAFFLTLIAACLFALRPTRAFASADGYTDITVTYSDYEGLVYNGRVQEITAEAEGYEIKQIDYGRVPRNAGVYTATAIFADENLRAANSVTFTIARKTLTAVLRDVTAVEGTTPNYSVTYDGFIDGESEADFLETPTVFGAGTSVGTYDIFLTASLDITDGVSLGNYKLETVPRAKLTVARAVLTSENVTVKGAFSPTGTLEVEEGAAGFDFLRLRYNAVLYLVRFDGELKGEKYCYKVETSAKNFPLLTRVSVTDANGKKHAVTNFHKTEDGFEFYSASDGEISIYYDFTPIVIIVAAAVLIAVFIGLRSRRDKKKCKNYERAHEGAKRQVDLLIKGE